MISLGELARTIDATCVGDTEQPIDSVADLKTARPGQISFLTSKDYLPFLESTKASAVITSEKLAEGYQGNLLLMANPYLGYAKTAQLLDTTPKPAAVGIHPTAVIAEDAILGENVSIGPLTVIEADCQVGDNVCIGANVCLGQGVEIGADSLVYPNVTFYHGVKVGKRAIFHSGSVVGSDGFGFANESGSWVKIPQLGRVVIGDDFEAGANTTIDRGALEDTKIGNGVILDNLVHIAHNVKLGDKTAIAATSGIAGGTRLGKGCTVSGRVSIIGHLEICDNVHLTVDTLVTRSIDKPGIYSSGDVAQPNRQWKRKIARLRQLDDLFQKVKQLEADIEQLQQDRDSEND